MPALRLDTHLHTRRHSRCSGMDEFQLIPTAIARGLNGVVITEHHYQWPEEELQELRIAANAPADFVLLSGFEYSSEMGDILVYGLAPQDAMRLAPGKDPRHALDFFHGLGAACIAAHPTRELIHFDERIAEMRFEAIETASRNLRPHEQRLALKLANDLGIPPSAASDAHRVQDIGACATDFEGPIRTMADFVDCLRRGVFKPAPGQLSR